MEEISKTTYSDIQLPEKGHGINYLVTFVIVAALLIVSYFIYTYLDTDTVREDNIIYSKEEKLEILEGLLASSDDSFSIEEKEEVLNKVSENNPANTKELSREKKLNILYSLE